jgi:hypothetical protein
METKLKNFKKNIFKKPMMSIATLLGLNIKYGY